MSAGAAAISRVRSARAVLLASSIICEARCSACKMICDERWRASPTDISACLDAFSSVTRACSASARPAMIFFCRSSIARVINGQMNRLQNQINSANVIACAIKVRLKFIVRELVEHRQQRVSEGKEHRQADADNERCVDQAEQQKHFGLKLRHQFRLARGTLKKAAAHDADADAGAQGTEADHQSDADAGVRLNHCQQL